MRAALCLLLLCVVAWAHETPDPLRALKHMCEVEELLVATFWNQTLAREGLIPEQIELFHEMRTRMKAGRCVYTDQAHALEDEESATRTCISEREKKVHDDYREAVASGTDALNELKKFNAHIESLESKESDTEERLQASVAKLGQATVEHERARRELQESGTALGTLLARFKERLTASIPAFVPPSKEAAAEFEKWREEYELQSAVNNERIMRAIQASNEAVREAEENMRAAEATILELKAITAKKRQIAPASEANAAAQ